MAAINERSVSEHLGRTVREVLADSIRERVEARIREARDTGRVVTEDDVTPGAGATVPRRPGAATTGRATTRSPERMATSSASGSS